MMTIKGTKCNQLITIWIVNIFFIIIGDIITQFGSIIMVFFFSFFKPDDFDIPLRL